MRGSADPLAAEERAQALVLLATRGAAVEMRAQPGDRGVRVGAGELELDVAVELVEARLAADLGLGRTEQPGDRLVQVCHVVSSRWARSLRRASCSVL